MKITFIEPTPSPNSMKLHLDESLEPGIRKTYTLDNERSAPAWIRELLHIQGVKSIFHTLDFIALDRKGSADWQAILSEVQEKFGQEGLQAGGSEEAAGAFGEAEVFVQFFRGIPMQIRVKSALQEERIGLSQRFTEAVTQVASNTMIKERKLKDYGVRYGELADIAREVEQELEAAFPQERLDKVVSQAIAHGAAEEEFIEQRRKLSDEETAAAMKDSDWRVRYAALDVLEPEERHLPLLKQALSDSKMQIRRLAIVYLGDFRTPEAMALLQQAMADESPAVRRTAGDTLSDIGDPAATPVMIQALKDSSKLVRWRAARFLYEVGTEEASGALTEAAEDPEFEVSLQARMALERIQSGEEAAGTVWQQMAKRTKDVK
ncbi:virulence factor [Paenibacillus sp. F411]|uniref:PBS lyase HEAT domain protein repeat-containing protein n=1 Tax=Paenibacillus algicola TaxID=2565926 RepID=A0A4P8XR63_9BACL|nr:MULTISPECIES: virulence factor [Paenibacillus]MBO2945552.1 virulence factor [Paenibacillus sp. F411]QCT04271.1 PBS lyase HEAT domain protein repeat-containing protein [Paenibacillus algicola]